MINEYPLNTRSGSTDIEGIENTLKAMRASIGYSVALTLERFGKLGRWEE